VSKFSSKLTDLKISYRDIGLKHKKCTCIEQLCQHKKNSNEQLKEYRDFNYNQEFIFLAKIN